MLSVKNKCNGVPHPSPGPLYGLPLQTEVLQHGGADLLGLQHHAVPLGEALAGALEPLRVVQQLAVLLVRAAPVVIHLVIVEVVWKITNIFLEFFAKCILWNL